MFEGAGDVHIGQETQKPGTRVARKLLKAGDIIIGVVTGDREKKHIDREDPNPITKIGIMIRLSPTNVSPRVHLTMLTLCAIPFIIFSMIRVIREEHGMSCVSWIAISQQLNPSRKGSAKHQVFHVIANPAAR